MKGIIESILDNEDVVLNRMSSREDDLLWDSTKKRYDKALWARHKTTFLSDMLGRQVINGDWVLLDCSLHRVTDINNENKTVIIEGSRTPQMISFSEFGSKYIKIMDKVHFAKNLSV